jgi:hypothetical protein
MRAADAMVLTEWKMVREKDDPAVRATAAMEQAKQYTRDTLAGFELSSRRYIVLVSERVLNWSEQPQDIALTQQPFEHKALHAA